MREIDLYNVSPDDPQAVADGLAKLRQDFDSHQHDGINSKSFETLLAETIRSRVISIKKSSYDDTVAGLWTGLVGSIAKLNLGDGTTYLKWDGSSLNIAGNATFSGTLSAASGTLGAITIGTNAWHVDSSGNLWWGNYTTYASATYKISAAGVANLSGLVVGTNVDIGTAQTAGQVTTIIGNTVTTGFVNALSITAQYVAASISITTPAITGGTITGGDIRTASSGRRVSMESSAGSEQHAISFYNTSGTVIGRFTESSGGVAYSGGGTLSIGAAINPSTDGGYNIGSSGARWGSGYFYSILSIDQNFVVAGSVIIDSSRVMKNITKFQLPVGTNLY